MHRQVSHARLHSTLCSLLSTTAKHEAHRDEGPSLPGSYPARWVHQLGSHWPDPLQQVVLQRGSHLFNTSPP